MFNERTRLIGMLHNRNTARGGFVTNRDGDTDLQHA
jgi:hypothetical protein